MISYYFLKKFNILGINDTGQLVLLASTLQYIDHHTDDYAVGT